MSLRTHRRGPIGRVAMISLCSFGFSFFSLGIHDTYCAGVFFEMMYFKIDVFKNIFDISIIDVK